MCASAATLRPLRRILPGHSRDRHSYYPERKGSSADGAQSSDHQHGGEEAAVAVPDVYALRDCSQDGLRDNVAYEAAPHARHPGPSAELRTAIYGGAPAGGRRVRGLDRCGEGDPRDAGDYGQGVPAQRDEMRELIPGVSYYHLELYGRV